MTSLKIARLTIVVLSLANPTARVHNVVALTFPLSCTFVTPSTSTP